MIVLRVVPVILRCGEILRFRPESPPSRPSLRRKEGGDPLRTEVATEDILSRPSEDKDRERSVERSGLSMVANMRATIERSRLS